MEGHLPGGLADTKLGTGNSGGLVVQNLLNDLRQVGLNVVDACGGEGSEGAEFLELFLDLLLGLIRLDVLLSKSNQELANLAFLGT